MEVNSKKLDKLYEEWCGVHHTENSCRPVHDSAECVDFAEHCLKYAIKVLLGNNKEKPPKPITLKEQTNDT